MSRSERTVDAYCLALEHFSAETIDELLALCADDLEFRDPFNHCFSKDCFQHILEHMLRNVHDLRFEVINRKGADKSWVIKWRFRGRARVIGELDIPGLSEINVDKRFLIYRHIDYWDAYENVVRRIPVAGRMLDIMLRPLRA